MNWLQSLGRSGLSFFERLGRGHLFLLNVLISSPGIFLRFRLLLQQMFGIGVLSLLIIVVAGLFVGLWAALAALAAARRDPWLFAALAGVLMHVFVDFDLQIPAIAALFVVLSALPSATEGVRS